MQEDRFPLSGGVSFCSAPCVLAVHRVSFLSFRGCWIFFAGDRFVGGGGGVCCSAPPCGPFFLQLFKNLKPLIPNRNGMAVFFCYSCFQFCNSAFQGTHLCKVLFFHSDIFFSRLKGCKFFLCCFEPVLKYCNGFKKNFPSPCRVLSLNVCQIINDFF